MGFLFSKNKVPESRVTEQDKAVLKLKQTRDKLKQYQKRIVLSQVKERELAKKCIADGRKDKALRLLKKKKLQDKLLEQTDNQLDNIEQMVNNIETKQMEIQVMNGLDQGNEALKELHKIMSLDDVERIMGDTEDAIEYQNEIDDILSGGLSVDETNEDDLLTELQDILGDDISDQLPEVPDTKLPEPAKDPGRQKNRSPIEALVAG